MNRAEILDLERIPVGIADFEQLRSLGMIYVDKTDQIYELTRIRSPVFLSRPRRFGKSLLTSTLKSLFAHGTKYFHGLKIESLWHEPSAKVLHLDLSVISSEPDEFKHDFLTHIKQRCDLAGISYADDAATISSLLGSILVKERDLPLVLLVDEYDLPLVENMEDPASFTVIRNIIRGFFLFIKANSFRFRFIYVTGIARFAQASVFSAPNSFTDISLEDRFASLLGFTEQEIKDYFSPYLQRLAAMTADTTAGVLDQLKRNYDGFTFGQNLQQSVFNSWSVLKALKSQFTHDKSQIYDSYWSYSGSFSMLMNFLQQATKQDDNIKLLSSLAKGQENYYSLSRNEFDLSSDLNQVNPVLMLFLSGFLTLREKEEGGHYLLGLPNEVVRSFIGSNVLISLRSQYAAHLRGKGSEADRQALYAALAGADCEKVALSLRQCLNQLTYRQKEQLVSEYDFSANIYLVLNCLGYAVRSEQELLHGRTDLTLTFDYLGRKYCAVFEFKLLRDIDGSLSIGQIKSKCDGLLEAAATQIREKRYYLSGLPGTSPVCFAVVFSAKDKDVAAVRLISIPEVAVR